MSAFSITYCRECYCHDISWFVGKDKTDIQDGRLRMHDISVFFYLGCNYCSETLATVTEDAMLAHINNVQG
jgi:hypothetical protein